ncbi:MAG TPA: hypothetical protein VK869_01020 [Rubrobacteraceae bacterium]|nr:hypothetical protein [Rubrobacteraceae bacterium]
MRKLKVLGATLVMALLVASPAVADTVTAEIGGVSATAESVFLGNDTATAEVGNLSAEAENEFLFFDDGVFDNGFWFFD